MNNLNILSSLSEIKNMFLIVSVCAFFDMFVLVFLMRFIDNKVNKLVGLIVKVVTYGTLFSLLLALVIFIITTYLSSLSKYVINSDPFTKLILDNTGSILTCITIPISVIGTLMAKTIEQVISKLNSNIIDIMNKKFNATSSTIGFWVFIGIVIVIPVLDCIIYILCSKIYK